MERGKQVCKILKDIRKQIAEENDIEFITSECTHKGDCAGTCPKCEAEVRYLEQQLARRRSAGRQMRLAGISLGLAAVAPALVSCDPLRGDAIDVIEGAIIPPLSGDPVVEPPVNVQLGENLIFDLIPADVFMKAFAVGAWTEAEIYDVYPDGSLGEEILARVEGYQPMKMVVTEEGKLALYHSSDEEPEIKEYFYDEWSNGIWIEGDHAFTVASVNDEEMVCYGPVFSQKWAPEAFLGKYVFRHPED